MAAFPEPEDMTKVEDFPKKRKKTDAKVSSMDYIESLEAAVDNLNSLIQHPPKKNVIVQPEIKGRELTVKVITLINSEEE